MALPDLGDDLICEVLVRFFRITDKIEPCSREAIKWLMGCSGLVLRLGAKNNLPDNMPVQERARWRERLKLARDICLDLSGFSECSILWLDLLIPPPPFTGIRKLILSERFDWCMIGNNPLASMVGLRELHIHARKPLVNAQEMVSCISSLTALRHLSFHGPERDPLTIKHNDRPNVQHAVAITEAISSLTQLEELAITAQFGSKEPPYSLLESVLICMRGLKRLELRSVYMGHTKDPAVYGSLTVISELTALTHLELQCLDCITDFDAGITPILGNLTALHHLGVSASYFWDSASFCNALRSMAANLTSLDISINNLRDFDGVRLADLISADLPHLAVLDASHNMFGECFAERFAEAIASKASLVSVHLGNNCMVFSGVALILMGIAASAAKEGHALRFVDLCENGIPVDSIDVADLRFRDVRILV